MKRLILGAIVIAVFVVAMCQAGAQNIPNVAGLTPFSPQAKYMSLPGYLRWQYFKMNGTWISLPEAAELVKNQTQ